MSLDKLLNKVSTQGKDQSQTTAGGGDYTPPAAGPTTARIVGYYEVGKHEFTYEGKTKTQDEVDIVIELIGKKHPPRELESGERIPVRMKQTLSLSQNEKSNFTKLFSRLRNDETHFTQLLKGGGTAEAPKGCPIMLDVEHTKKTKNGKEVVYANVKKDSIRKPIVQMLSDPTDPESDLVERVLDVGPALTPVNAFVWEVADNDDWNSLYIPGQYDERKNDKGEVTAPARSKNVLQLRIAAALNFKGLPCYDYAAAKLAGTVDEAGTKALEEQIGSVAGDDGEAVDPEDPMAGIA